MPSDDVIRLLELYPDAALLATASGVILAANRKLQSRLGILLEGVQNRFLTDLVADEPTVVANFLRTCSRSGNSIPGSLTLLRAGTNPLPCRCEGAVFRSRDRDAEPVVLLRIIPKETAIGQFLALNQRIEELNREIVRRQRAEAELWAERERLRVTLESIGDAVIVTDEKGVISFLNPVAESMTGWPEAEAIGKSLSEVFDIFNEYTRLPVENPTERVFREGIVVGLANHTVLRDRYGIERPIEDSAAPIRNEQGRTIGAVLVFHDVTDRRQAESALRASEARFRELADAMPQIVWAARPDGCVDYYNKRWYDYTGFPRGQAGDQSWEPILHPDDVQFCKETWYRSVQTGQPYQIEYRFKDRRTGGYRWHLGRALPIRDATGQIVRWYGSCTDIEDQKRAEESLREANARKDEFLAMLAHELRNPLAPILTGLRILGTADLDEAGRNQTVAMMDRQVRHMTRMIEDLLDVSRITRGKLTLRTERLDLAGIVRATVADYRTLCDSDKDKVAIHCDIPGHPIWVDGDATRLTQVVANLLQNACKFTEPGGRVDLWLGMSLNAPEVELWVRDTGMGIDAELLPRLFEPFSQADRTLHRASGGLGLGLALVKGLVELHGGRVEASSEGPGRGAEFVVRLPTVPEPAALSVATVVTQPSSPPVRVLVIEDNRDAADSLRMLLEVIGHEVRVAYSGPDGLAEAVAWQPDVILSDIGLPGQDGFEVARALRANNRTSGVLLVAVTGYGDQETRKRAQDVGFDHLLTKPADPTTLIQLLSSPR